MQKTMTLKKIVLLWQGGLSPLPDAFLLQIRVLCLRGNLQEILLLNLYEDPRESPGIAEKSVCYPERLFRHLVKQRSAHG